LLLGLLSGCGAQANAAADGPLIDALAEFWNVPEGYYAEPLGKARTLRIGEGAPVAIIVSWGAMLLESAIAAARFADAHQGTLVEVIDLRPLMPFDEEAIRQSVAAGVPTQHHARKRS
jgi:pyruvate/2-oxoglutarate/acetoin dehydrogenase E1 component